MAGTRRKICFVLPSLNGGGAERAAVHIMNALDAGRWDRQMYLFRREGAYLDEVSDSIRLEVSASGSRVGRWLALRQFIREAQPDIVMSFLSYFSVLSAARAARVGTRVVFNQQTPMSAFLEDRDYHWRRPWHRRAFSVAARVGYAAADLVITTSQGVADDLVRVFGVDAARIRVVHNPVDLSAIAAKAAEPIDPMHEALWSRPALVAAGRLADAKNYPLLIESFAILRRRLPARLFILGEGEREPQLRALVAARGLEDAVHFCGFRQNPWAYMARADVFVLTSRYEGFGNVLVEAMACGVPVVATSSPGTAEILAGGAGGLLVERHDAADVAAALEQLLGDADRRRRMAQAARERAAAFAISEVAASYERVFGEMVA